jgi:hypothetical protein
MSDLSRETKALLERGRAGMPLTPAHRARLRGAILAKATGVALVATAGSASAWTSLGAKIVGAAVLVATAGGVGAAIEWRMSNGRAPSTESPTAISNHVGPPMASPIPAPASAPIPALAASSVLIKTPSSIPAPASTRQGTLIPVAAAPASSAVPTPDALPASAPTTTLAREVRLLRDADLAVKGGDPERALTLLDEHAAAFPRSDLEPERSAERVFALCRAGRIEEARSAASAFLGAHPTGPLAERVKDGCREGSRE